MQIAPAAEMGAAQDAADGGGTESGGACDLVGGTLPPPQLDDLIDQTGRSGCGDCDEVVRNGRVGRRHLRC